VPVRDGFARLVALTFTGWLGASAVEQLRFPGVQRYRRWDVLGLIPVWTFFAPNPATGDFYVVYRDELNSGALTAWVETATPRARQRLLASIWNPDRRATKALFDIGSALSVVARDFADPEAVQLTLPYLALLTFVCSQAHHTREAVATQFMLLTDHGLDKPSAPVPVFLSRWHNL
jgi:hypothetical protein